MKTIRQITGLVVLLFLPAAHSLAIEGLELQICCPDVVLRWPSTNGETFLVQYRATLDTNSAWETLTNFMPAIIGTNTTLFVHSNRVDCPAGQVFGMMLMSGGGDVAMNAKAVTLSVAERIELRQAREETRLAALFEKCKLEDREPYEWELKNQPPLPPSPEEVRAKILKAKAARAAGLLTPSAEASLPGEQTESGNMNGPETQEGSGAGGVEPACGFYRVVRNGLHLSVVTNGMTVSGYLELPIELGATNSGLPQIKFFLDGQPCTGAGVALGAKGFPVVKWYSSFVPNGTHNIWLVADFAGEEDILYSETNTVIVANDVAFDVNLNAFGEQIWFFADFSEPVSYEIKIYEDDSNSYIGSFFGDTDPDGIVSFLWDLIDPLQNLVTNQFIRGEFYGTTQSSQSATGGAAGPQASGGTTKPATNIWTKQSGWFSDKFIVAWANTAKINAPARMEELMRYGVVDILANPAHNAPYVLSPGNAFSTGTSFRLTDYTRTNLFNYLSDPEYRNFYFNGHGNSGGFGDSSRWMDNPPWIQEDELRTVMTNHLGQTPRAITKHPYRFVFMDTCNGANGNLCEAFGIHRWPGLTVSAYVNNFKMKPRAYVGFRETVPLPASQAEHLFNANMLAGFFARWMDGVNLNGCVVVAKQDPNWPLHPSVQIFGAYNLYRNAP